MPWHHAVYSIHPCHWRALQSFKAGGTFPSKEFFSPGIALGGREVEDLRSLYHCPFRNHLYSIFVHLSLRSFSSGEPICLNSRYPYCVWILAFGIELQLFYDESHFGNVRIRLNIVLGAVMYVGNNFITSLST